MKRIHVAPRCCWQRVVEEQGYLWHTEGDHPCWREDACYVLTDGEVQLLRRTGDEVYQMLIKAADHVVKNGLWSRVGISDEHARIVAASWESGARPMAGRFDLLVDEQGQPKLLEFNADCALTMLETAVIQRDWQKTGFPGAGQLNELHERLVSAWRSSGLDVIHVAWRPRHPEVEGTMRYIAKTVREAGLEAVLMAMHCVGYDAKRKVFVDRDLRAIRCCYKLYPWGWMLEEPFARHVESSSTEFIEPASAHLLGSKGLLSVLWDLFPDHPAILPCHDEPPSSGAYVSKPMLGCEGHNISIHGMAEGETTDGEFAEQRRVHQQFVRTVRHDGWLPQMGLWMVGGQCAALGIREDTHLILQNESTFVPHIVMKAENGGEGGN